MFLVNFNSNTKSQSLTIAAIRTREMKKDIHQKLPTKSTLDTEKLYHGLEVALCVSLRALTLIVMLFGSVLAALVGGGHLPLSGRWRERNVE